MKRIIRTMVWGAIGLLALYTLLEGTVGVSFIRRVPLDNDPLTNSVLVTSVSSNRITLADGRILVMEGFPPEFLAHEMRDSRGRIELDDLGSRFSNVYVRQKRFICGTYAPRVIIALVHQEYPGYKRRPLGLGSFQ